MTCRLLPVLNRSLILCAALLLAACDGTISETPLQPLPIDSGSVGGGTEGVGGGSEALGGGTAAPIDAGPIDAGPIDSGVIDAGPVDAGLPTEDVHFIGRFDDSNPSGPRSDWSGTGYITHFRGTGIGVTLEGSTNQFAVVVDQNTPTVFKFNGQPGVVTLAENLPNTDHTLQMYRRTEASFGPVRFKGFTVTGGAIVPTPAPFTRKIEIIGDSISCGYGNEGASESCGFSADTENEYLAYGAITARALNAAHQVIAWSGRGMYRNYGGDMSDTMPVLYSRTLATASNSTWDTTRYTPDVIVIDLGTNDFSGNVDPGQPYVAAYLAFVTRLRGLYPDAHIFCTVGPMNNSMTFRDDVGGVVMTRTQAGDSRIHFVEFAQQGSPFGCDYHPSLGTHQQMATTITAAIRTATGW